MLGGLLGVWPWLRFGLGWGVAPSGYAHGLLQIQGFEMPFAVGFLMTVIPRFLETRPTRVWELTLGWCLGAAAITAFAVDAWRLGEMLFLGLGVHIMVYGLRRLHGRGDDPPPFFAFLPVGFISAVGGAALILWPLAGFARLGERLVEQGILLAFVLAIGSHLGPRLLYGNRTFPETTTPAAHRRLLILGGLGLLLLATFPLEAGGFALAGQLLRALIVTSYLMLVLRVYRTPERPWLHVRLLRLSFLSLCAGLWLAPLWPAVYLAAMHLTFIGGFGLMTVIIATRVVTGHCDAESLWDEQRWQVTVPASLVALSVPARLLADLVPQWFLPAIAAAGALWLSGLFLWGVVFVPMLGPSHVTPD